MPGVFHVYLEFLLAEIGTFRTSYEHILILIRAVQVNAFVHGATSAQVVIVVGCIGWNNTKSY